MLTIVKTLSDLCALLYLARENIELQCESDQSSYSDADTWQELNVATRKHIYSCQSLNKDINHFRVYTDDLIFRPSKEQLRRQHFYALLKSYCNELSKDTQNYL